MSVGAGIGNYSRGPADSSSWLTRHAGVLSLCLTVLITGGGGVAIFAVSSERISSGIDRDNALSTRLTEHERRQQLDHDVVMGLVQQRLADQQDIANRGRRRDQQAEETADRLKSLEQDRLVSGPLIATLVERLNQMTGAMTDLSRQVRDMDATLRQRLPDTASRPGR